MSFKVNIDGSLSGVPSIENELGKLPDNLKNVVAIGYLRYKGGTATIESSLGVVSVTVVSTGLLDITTSFDATNVNVIPVVQASAGVVNEVFLSRTASNIRVSIFTSSSTTAVSPSLLTVLFVGGVS